MKLQTIAFIIFISPLCPVPLFCAIQFNTCQLLNNLVCCWNRYTSKFETVVYFFFTLTFDRTFLTNENVLYTRTSISGWQFFFFNEFVQRPTFFFYKNLWVCVVYAFHHSWKNLKMHCTDSTWPKRKKKFLVTHLKKIANDK